MTAASAQKDNYAEYANKFFGGSVEFDLEREKPDTVSYFLAAIVGHVRKLASVDMRDLSDRRLILNVGVTSELHGNGYAEEYEGQFYIGLTFGHFMSNLYFSTEVFYKTKCFSDFDYPMASDDIQIEICPDVDFWDKRASTLMDDLSKIKMVSLPRVHGMYFLTYAMTSIGFFHEYFHFISGHSGAEACFGLSTLLHENGFDKFSNKSTQDSKLFEVIEDSEIAAALRSLEVVADQEAIIILMKSILSDADLPTSGKIVNISQKNRIRLALVAAGLLSTSWSVWQKRSGTSDPTHPEPGARFIHFFICAKQVLVDQNCGEMFEECAIMAMDDLANIARRCNDLAKAMPEIASGRPRSDTIKPISAEIAKLLKGHQFRFLR